MMRALNPLVLVLGIGLLSGGPVFAQPSLPAIPPPADPLLPPPGLPLPSSPRLKFGMEISVHPLGVAISELVSDRPIAQELKAGDILVSYVLTNKPALVHPLRSSDDIDQLLDEVAEGATVNLFVLRPKAGSPPTFLQLQVMVDAGRLSRPTRVVVEERGDDLVPVAGLRYSLVKEALPAPQPPAKTVLARLPWFSPAETASSFAPAPAEPAPARSAAFVRVPVFYCTDRTLGQDNQYSDRLDEQADPLKFGVCHVTIPADHTRGELEAPKWWRLEFSEDAARHVVLAKIVQLKQEEVFTAAGTHANNRAAEDGKRRVLVFVHGYNVGFEDAARRTAQLQFDLKFPGAALFFSWPSNAKYADYPADLADIDLSSQNIRRFLQLVESDPTLNVDEIHLIAHSLGNRGVGPALVELKKAGLGKKIRQIILAAPDIDARIFDRDIAPVLTQFPKTTVYASRFDRALWANGEISQAFRLGQIVNGEPTVKSRSGIDLVDTSQIQTDLFGHSAFSSSAVMDEIRYLILGKDPPSRLRVQGTRGEFWRLPAPR